MSAPLPRWVTLGWASGTLGSSTLLGAINLVVLFYFTEYLGIAPATAGVLIFVSRIWDIAAAVWIGQWSDRLQRDTLAKQFAGGMVDIDFVHVDSLLLRLMRGLLHVIQP